MRGVIVSSSPSSVSTRLYSSTSLEARKKELIDRILRVDHAGESVARHIYKGQLHMLESKDGSKEIQEMYEQEKHHYDTMDRLVRERRARPTLFLPVWDMAGFVLGAATAALGKEAAMACTEAVETEIGNHYNNQLRELIELAPEDEELRKILTEFRDDELHHLDVAVEEGAHKAPGYDVLVNVIRTGCKAAIYVAERVMGDDSRVDIPRFHDLFRQPDTAIGLDDAVAERSNDDSVFLKASRKCMGICHAANQCFRDGRPVEACVDLYIQSRGCLASFFAKKSFEKASKCISESRRYDTCQVEVLEMQKAVEKVLTKEGRNVHFSQTEQKAFDQCGYFTLTSTMAELDANLGCSMAIVAPQVFAVFTQCLEKNGGEMGKCTKEGRRLMKEFQPFMEKVWIKDPYFLIRGTKLKLID